MLADTDSTGKGSKDSILHALVYSGRSTSPKHCTSRKELLSECDSQMVFFFFTIVGLSISSVIRFSILHTKSFSGGPN